MPSTENNPATPAVSSLTPRPLLDPALAAAASATPPTLETAPSQATDAESAIFTTTPMSRVLNFLGVTIPIAGLAVAIVLLWGVAFNWIYLAILVGMYLATGLGITVGFHRYFTHKSFETPRWMVFVLGMLGSMAAQGSILEWTAVHRRHHQHSDKPDDPHSPHVRAGTKRWLRRDKEDPAQLRTHPPHRFRPNARHHHDHDHNPAVHESLAGSFIGTVRGLWHAHVGWLFHKRPRGLIRYVGDLRRDRLIRVTSDLFPLWVLLGMLFPAVLAGLLTMSWTGVLLGFLWGGLVRVFLVHHVTWSVNSVCHIWGSRPFDTHDHSRNNLLFGVLALGEGWHNNHHAFPTSARHGLRWWQLDLSYECIRALSLVGLARDIRVPALQRVEAKRRR